MKSTTFFALSCLSAILVLAASQSENENESAGSEEIGIAPDCFTLCSSTCDNAKSICLQNAKGTENDVPEYHAHCEKNYQFCANMCARTCDCANKCTPICNERHPECDLSIVNTETMENSTACGLEFGSCSNYCIGVCATAIATNRDPVLFEEDEPTSEEETEAEKQPTDEETTEAEKQPSSAETREETNNKKAEKEPETAKSRVKDEM